jgi:DNA helicase-2/ATP-dependent DNA helicase PcrA
VFDNKTLVAIARTVPSTLTELSRISGVGPAKLERYGEAVIALLAKPA